MPNVCIVTQYYRYGSLEGALRGKTRLELTWKQVIKIAMEAASGILHLHKEGVLHSRISSRNILIGDGMRAYVNDFAFCHMKPKESVYTHTAGTSSFIGPGTSSLLSVLCLCVVNVTLMWYHAVRYMSPDAMMHKYSEGSDAWSFGKVPLVLHQPTTSVAATDHPMQACCCGSCGSAGSHSKVTTTSPWPSECRKTTKPCPSLPLVHWCAIASSPSGLRRHIHSLTQPKPTPGAGDADEAVLAGPTQPTPLLHGHLRDARVLPQVPLRSSPATRDTNHQKTKLK
jgi:serine/threonine protein kinase